MSNEIEVVCAIYDHLEKLLPSKAMISCPLPLTPHAKLVNYNPFIDGVNPSHFDVTFMLPPHKSLIVSYHRVLTQLEKIDFLNEREVKDLGQYVILTYLLSSSELTEAEEMTYFANQYVRREMKSGQDVSLLHIGGAHHTKPLFEILSKGLPNFDSRTIVKETYDSQTGPYRGGLATFIRDSIPFESRIKALSMLGNETMLDPDLVSLQVNDALVKHREDLEIRISIAHAIKEMYPDVKVLSVFNEACRKRTQLYDQKIGQ